MGHEVMRVLRAGLPDAAFPEGAGYFEEPRGRFAGSGHVVAPGSVEEVSVVMRACHRAGVPVVPYGGGTGLVGGQLMEDGAPVVLSLQRMAAVREVDAAGRSLVAEAGAILADVQRVAEETGRLFPLSLASGGSARIGGLLATNAGGVNVLRYGSARALCLGIEAVLADGRVWNGLSRLGKDNTGYDLRDLLIGSEGTLGVITAASLRLFPRPESEAVALMAVQGPSAALRLLGLAEKRVGSGVSAFELIARQGMDFLAEVGPEVRVPLNPMPDWMVLIELGLSGADAGDTVEALFAEAAEAGLVSDGVVARSEAQRAALWHLRESIPAANRRIGAIASHDISVPVDAVPDFIRRGREVVARFGDLRVNCFGHLGDGNLHYNVFPPKGRDRSDYDPQRAEISRAVHDLVAEMDGSFSAEHGVGRLKVADLQRYGNPVKIAMMRAVKTALDPKGILNPGAVLAQS